MINYINGDLLDFPKGINRIAHSCNTQGIMGAGIALQIKNRYPNAYKADLSEYHAGDNILGSWSFAYTDATCSLGVFNMYTQEKIGGARAVNYEAFYCALQFVAEHIEWLIKNDEEITLGIPHGISCGLAGGAWSVIESMIQDILSKKSFDTYIVSYNPV